MKNELKNSSFNQQNKKNIVTFKSHNHQKTYTPDRKFRFQEPAQNDQFEQEHKPKYEGRKTMEPPARKHVHLSQNDINNKNSYMKQGESTHTECFNHSNKTPKYKIVSQDLQLLYCQKCAILMASQGFKVQKLEKQDIKQTSKDHFQQQAKIFSDQIQDYLSQIQFMKLKQSQQKEVVSEYCKSILQKFNEYQKQLHTKIQLFMGRQKKEIDTLFQQFNGTIQRNIQSICKSEKELKDIVKDIQINLPTIDHLQQDEFNPIMREYNKILDRTMKNIKNISKDDYKIGVLYKKPETLHNLSVMIDYYLDKIESQNQNSQPQRQKSFQKSCRTKVCSSSKSKKSTNIKSSQHLQSMTPTPSPFLMQEQESSLNREHYPIQKVLI